VGKKSKKYKIRNQGIWDDLRVKTLQDKVMKLKIHRYAHVLHAPENRIPMTA
jgi:hypothetical protein